MEQSEFTILARSDSDKSLLYSVLIGEYVEIENQHIHSLLKKNSLSMIANKVERSIVERGYFKERDFDELRCLMFILKSLYFSGKRIDLILDKRSIANFKTITKIINILSNKHHVYLHVDGSIFNLGIEKFDFVNIVTNDFSYTFRDGVVYRIVEKLTGENYEVLKDLMELYYYTAFVNALDILDLTDKSQHLLEFVKIKQEEHFVNNMRVDDILELEKKVVSFLKKIEEGYYEV
ncbi:hypothetical protein D3H64_10010 [Atopobacter sp. AH10]|uniref:hypothetical protein n=1 Tax=Atopobacter sp. AH10 TaxID=2315861 RepID=UPI000EF19587|nr:hypothetical protein [Atopobacter sp. AH10]RLK62396.1 hypothetical protein D3H64_10010 [Atopobacter sp. AH10]